MNGSRFNYEDYAWEPEAPEDAINYYVADTTPVEPHLAEPIVVTPHESVLTRPVGELISAALADTVLTKPVGELLSSAINDTVLTRPVGELIASARESMGRTWRPAV